MTPTFLQPSVARLPCLMRLAHDGRILDVNAAGLAAFGGATSRAVVGSSIYVYVPVDCTTQRDEKEKLQAFSLFGSFGYRYNVTVTRSDLIQF